MNLRVREINKNFDEFYKVEDLYKTAFPSNERIPLWFLMRKSKKEFIDYIAFYDNDLFVGFAYLITNNNLTFVLYLAISPEIRSIGYGTAILSKISEKYADNRIILNIEADNEVASNYEERLKRKKFYLRNGYRSTGLNIFEYGQIYEVLVYGNDVSPKEYQDLFKKFIGPLLILLTNPKISNVHHLG
ncbi:GNAT family N-acetyltransferase [Paenibacillus anaericanus]|uniref:GNAT family N-acetyltransferase n=1 Tax=Paenibacillus anaericanus TaxID=170367 RepID=A0A3S1DIS2_9BACL|nr:GNAT family N-acetyltransferase [Paenibacillus anaericanus]RUT40321.1 GNAT family N-acetyltransferase [Paenibacillus anaericanus]